MERKEKPTQVDFDKKNRKDWGDVRPVSQYFRDKTKYTRKDKYKKDYEAQEKDQY